jgi:tRNA acetyltransferase TAN1
MDESKKRKSESATGGSNSKRSKPWRVPKKGQANYAAPSIEPGDAGIWATCEMGKEGKCTAELKDLFEQYAAKLYGGAEVQVETASDDDAEVDIEAEIEKEVRGIKSKSTKKETLFQPVRVDIQCVLFFKTRKPIEPVEFVHRICQDALEGATKRHRWVKRLTPMTMMGKATVEGLEKVAQSVLQPVFHAEGTPARKFAIRPTRRNHNIMKRDEIIRQIASVVGAGHSVDLKNYDYLILVDVYRVS